MDLLVNIVLVTYNHGKYIAEAIESVLAQKTDFSYLLIIGEDCSTDNTAEICCSYQKKFPDKVLLLKSDVNKGLVLNYQRAFNACTAKYIAILEGDDFWTDPLKLQKQVDILGKDNSVGLVHTNFDRLYENGRLELSKKNTSRLKPENGYVFEQLIRENFITSITSCFRSELFKKYVDFDEFIEEKLFTIDYSIWLELSYRTKIYYLSDSTAVYRVLDSSLSNNNDFITKELYYNKGRNIKKYYIRKFSPTNFTTDKVDRVYDTGLLYWAIRLNNQGKAIEYLNKAMSGRILRIFLRPFIITPFLFGVLTYIINIRTKGRSIFKSRKLREFLNLR